MPGLTEDARFQNLRRLGQGGFGDVYAGFDTVRGAEVAIKKLRATGPESIYRFKQEFRVMEAIDHPNLVQLYELTAVGDDWVFTMELVHGEPFDRYVHPEGGALDVRRLRDALRQLAAGLTHLHGAGKLHLDVKPANVLIRPDGRLKLVDFGLATDVSESREDRTTDRSAGTLEYMAPEQAGAQPRTAATDWYPVGAMIYEALSGQLPFTGNPLKMLVDKSRSEAPPLPSDARALAPDLAALAERLLSRQPHLRPEGALVCDALGATLAAVPTLTAVRTPFVGRQAELSRLEAAWAAARTGTQTIVSVVGPSGMGKSTLVRHFAAMTAETDGALLLTGRCHERESVPFKGVDSLVDALAKVLARLEARGIAAPRVPDAAALIQIFPVLGRSLYADGQHTPAEKVAHATWRRRAFRALRELLCHLALRQPVMVTLDDLQWSDYDSFELLEVLFSPPAPVPMLLIASHRPEERARSPFLAHFAERLPHEVIELGPLGQAELRRLILGIAPTLDEREASAILDEAGGSPFLAAELARFSDLDLGDGAPSGPIKLETAVQTRLRLLSPGARTLLSVLAIAAGPVPGEALARCLPEDEGLDAALRPLQTDRLVWMHGGGDEREVEIAHARIGEAVVATFGDADRRELHARMAAAMMGLSGVAAATVGLHLEASGRLHQAVPHILRAADEAHRQLAFDRTVRFLQRALELGATADAGGRPLRPRLAEALALAGRSSESGELWLSLAQASGGAGPDEVMALEQRAAEQFLRAARIDEGLAALRALLTRLGVRWPETRSGLLLRLIGARLWVDLRLRLRPLRFEPRPAGSVPPEEARRADVTFTVAQCITPIDLMRGALMGAQMVHAALRTRDPARIARALAVEAAVVSTRGRSGRARAAVLLDRGRRLIDGLDAPESEAYLALCEAIALFQGGAWARCRRAAEAAAAAFRRDCPGLVWEQATADAYALGSMWFVGEIARVRDVSPERARDARARGDRYTEAYFVLAIYGLPAIFRDRPEEGLAEVEAAHAHWRGKALEFQDFYYLVARVYLLLYRGEVAAAAAECAAAAVKLRWSFLWQVEVLRTIFLEVRARTRLRTGDLDGARADARHLRQCGEPWQLAFADLIEGAAAATAGDRQRARDLLRRGAEAADRADMALFAQAARFAHGRLLGGARGDAEAAAALAWCEHAGAANPARLFGFLCPAGAASAQ